jgi:DeoR/GlpR family transcriptional regulator of sugar metabolism
MPHSASREQKILEILKTQGSASIQELTDVLGVSTMTVHRDLNRMAAAGSIQKTHGGASLATDSTSGCAMCGKPIHERTVFLFHLPSGEQRRACCAHCGLMLQQGVPGASHAMTADFLHGHMVSAGQAVFLLGGELTVCCVPSVLSFGSPAEAERFQKGFGGRLANMQEAMHFLHESMHTGSSA